MNLAHIRQRRREVLRNANRVVIKVGSSSLASANAGIDIERLQQLVESMAAVHTCGTRIILVSSGAIAAGLSPLGLHSRPGDLDMQQAVAAVGQGLLLAEYTASFGQHGIPVGQVLLTADDVLRRGHYRNAQRTLERLLSLGAVPIINENDSVGTDELKFGDNDRLASLVAPLVGADVLVLLSDVDALYDGPPHQLGAQRVPFVDDFADLDRITIKGAGSSVGTGGMRTKVTAARIATSSGVPVVLTSAAKLDDVLRGDDVGTWFVAHKGRASMVRLWLAHAAEPTGRLVMDDGAVRAVVSGGASLLPAGLMRVSGQFDVGEPVDLCDQSGHIVARGLVNYSSEELPTLIGRSTQELAASLGKGYDREVIHRNALVVLIAT